MILNLCSIGATEMVQIQILALRSYCYILKIFYKLLPNKSENITSVSRSVTKFSSPLDVSKWYFITVKNMP